MGQTSFEQFGVKPIINACSPMTRLSGGRMHRAVAEGMAAAAQECVDMGELQSAASTEIAAATGADAGVVTSGAAAGLLLAAAACICRHNLGKMDLLPDVNSGPNEFLISRSHRNSYDHAIRQAGGRLVEVGLPDRFNGAGVRDAEVWEFEAALTERTAGIVWVAHAFAAPNLESICRFAAEHKLPVIVDAAAEIPPVENFRHFFEVGATLVVFSGGKMIGGPQASGILAGRRDLIQSALLQMLDHDIDFGLWTPPTLLSDLNLMGLPHNGIGRPCKVGKEQIVGLLIALRHCLKEDPEVRWSALLSLASTIQAKLATLPSASVRVRANDLVRSAPYVVLEFTDPLTPKHARSVAEHLMVGSPSIQPNVSELHLGRLMIGVTCLNPSQIDLLCDRVRSAHAAVFASA